MNLLELWLTPLRVWVDVAGKMVEQLPKPPQRLYPKGSYFGKDEVLERDAGDG